MSFSLNKTILIGTLGKDAETKFTTSNVSITNFSLATENGYKDKDGSWKNETTWHNITAFSLSDFFKDALKKGKKFYVEGRIQKREYTDKDGIKRYSVNIISEKLIPLSATQNGNQETHQEETHSEPETPADEEESGLPF